MQRIALGLFLLCAGLASIACGQTIPDPGAPKSTVVIVNLLNPVYPPLARLANIMGDVKVSLEIRKDGSVASANAESGPKMLLQAALDSAMKSHFECHQCDDDLTPYTLIYSFEVSPKSDPDWPCPKEYTPQVVQSRNHVKLTVEPRMIRATFSHIESRSAKCLYLWRCGYKWGGTDFYYYRARSLRCLDMWKCGYKLREPYARCARLHRQIIY